jgi:hypothetical protein
VLPLPLGLPLALARQRGRRCHIASITSGFLLAPGLDARLCFSEVGHVKSSSVGTPVKVSTERLAALVELDGGRPGGAQGSERAREAGHEDPRSSRDVRMAMVRSRLPARAAMQPQTVAAGARSDGNLTHSRGSLGGLGSRRPRRG